MQELICVDLNDNEIGYKEKAAAHAVPTLHRAFSVFLYHDGKLLIQRRNRNKYHSGGLFANSCCSHPRKGESLAEAVPRRVMEEIGVDCEVSDESTDKCTVKEVFSFVYFSTYRSDLYEYEYDHVFLGEYNGEINFDPEEIEEVVWIKYDELKERMVKHPEEFATWFMIAAPKVLEILEGR